MIRRFRPVVWTALAVVIVAALLFGLDRRSIERGNRLFRAGDAASAADVYRAAASWAGGRGAYNLGTALLAMGSAESDSVLRAAAEAADPSLRQRAFYNHSLASLVQVRPSMSSDSAEAILRNAIASGRAAVRLDPADNDARWNLALAQRMLDSLTLVTSEPRSQEDAGTDDTRIDLDALTRSGEGIGESGLEPDEPESGESPGQRMAASEGAREAWATVDPGPMTPEDARRVLETIDDDPERLVRGTLWAGRPDVAWWLSQPFPGGDW